MPLHLQNTSEITPWKILIALFGNHGQDIQSCAQGTMSLLKLLQSLLADLENLFKG
jgi:hypothetical protein